MTWLATLCACMDWLWHKRNTEAMLAKACVHAWRHDGTFTVARAKHVRNAVQFLKLCSSVADDSESLQWATWCSMCLPAGYDTSNV